jgi:DNA polymerase-3 subunit alpha
MSFVHLHNHSHYSVLDALSKPKEIVKKAKELGMPAVALTDHAVVHGVVKFYKACKDEGIKPIIGCDMYITKDRFKKDVSVKFSNSLVLLCKNDAGYKNLLNLVTKASLEGFYYKPRIDHKLLSGYSEGLIALSGDIYGEIPLALLNNDENAAEEALKRYLEIFDKEDFYLEVQAHPEDENQIIVNKKLFEFAKKHDLKVVATNNTHFINKEDAEAEDALVCIGNGRTLNDPERFSYGNDYYMKTEEEMREYFKDNPEAVDNTMEISDKCNLELEFNQNLLPKYIAPDGKTSKDYLRELCEAGMERRYKNKDMKAARERLEYELKIIDQMGFNDYFLITWDFIRYAKDKGIVVGPGRGSAAGAIIAYCLDITTVDPLAYGLYFERFLNPERVSMPDIDIDFSDARREEVMEYVVEKYGRENVAQVCTFGSMAAKAAIRDVGRVLGYPYDEVDVVAKKVPDPIFGKYKPIQTYIDEGTELTDEYESNPRSKKLLDLAIKLEGTVRSIGTHACAVIISEEPLTNYTALQYGSRSDETITTQYDMKPLEGIGLLKMDFLGLRNLTIIERCLENIKHHKGETVVIDEVEYNDKKAFNLLSQGLTVGVFQLESAGMQKYLKELKPSRLEDIIAMNALYRPGPMQYIPQYIEGKHDPSSVKYLHPLFEEILEETYGVGVYQEQIMEIAKIFGGFSLGQADMLRRAVGKKIPELLVEQKQKFIEGAGKQGHDQKFAAKVFDDVIEPFAGYGFNKAHATCYAVIAYQTAYLKANYPVEYMAALLTSDLGNLDRVVLEIHDCQNLGINVLPPSINESYLDFTVIDDKTIRFGLGAIKGLGNSSIEEIITERKNGKFKSLEDLAQRVNWKSLNKKTIQALAYSGAFDEFGDRNDIALNYEVINKFAKSYQNSQAKGQDTLFGGLDDQAEIEALNLPTFKEMSTLELLKKEKEYLGMYVSKHPLYGLTNFLRRKVSLSRELCDVHNGKKVKLCGFVNDIRRFKTKKGDYMMVFRLEDIVGSMSVVVFPRMYKNLSFEVKEDMLLFIEGKFDNKRGDQVILDKMKKFELEDMIKAAKDLDVYAETENISKVIQDIEALSNPVIESVNRIKVNIPEGFDKNGLQVIKEMFENNPGEKAVTLVINTSKGQNEVELDLGVDFEAIKEDLIDLIRLKGESL